MIRFVISIGLFAMAVAFSLTRLTDAHAGASAAKEFFGTWKTTKADGFDVVMVIGKDGEFKVEITYLKNGKEVGRGHGKTPRINVSELLFVRGIDANIDPPLSEKALCKLRKTGDTLELSYMTPADRKNPKEIYTRVETVVAKGNKKPPEPEKPGLSVVAEFTTRLSLWDIGAGISPDGKKIAVRAPDSPDHMVVYDVASGQLLHNLLIGLQGGGLAWSGDGGSLAVFHSGNAAGVGKAHAVSVLDTTTWKSRLTFYLPGTAPRQLTLSGDGKVVVVCSGKSGDNGYIKGFSLTSKREILTGRDNQEKPSLELTGDGKLLATNILGGVALIDVVAQKPVLTLKDNAVAVTVSADGATLAFAEDSKIHIFDRKQKKVIRSIELKGWTPTNLAFVNKAAALAAVGIDHNTLHVYDVATGDELFKATPKEGGTFLTVRAAARSSRLLTVSQSRAYVWSIPEGK